jgi:hypothetical protein
MSNEWNYEAWFASPEGMKAIKSIGERPGLDLSEINDPRLIARIIVNAVPQSSAWLPKSLVNKDDERDAKQLLGQLAGDYPDENEMCGWLALLKHGVSDVSVPYYGGTDQIDLGDDFAFSTIHGNTVDSNAILDDFKNASGSSLEDYFWNAIDDSGAGDGTTYSSTWTTCLIPEFSQHTTDPVWDENEPDEYDDFEMDSPTETPLGEQLDENNPTE